MKETKLPELPTTRDTQVEQPANQASADSTQDKDWSQVSAQVNAGIQQAIALYEQGEAKKAMLAVQDTYFDIFESTGMENKVGSRDSNFKTQLEGYFTRLVSLMKAGAEKEKLQEQAQGLSQDFKQSCRNVTGRRTNCMEYVLIQLINHRS